MFAFSVIVITRLVYKLIFGQLFNSVVSGTDSKLWLTPHCRVLPPGIFYGVIPCHISVCIFFQICQNSNF